MGNKTTSIAALLCPSKQTKRQRRKEAILRSITANPATRYEVAQRLDVPVNCVTSSVLDLINEGLIYESKRVLQETGHKGWRLEVVRRG